MDAEKARLIWVGDPFRYDNKIMLYAYFQSKGVTKKVLLDWGTLPCLAIQHYYSDGVITTSQPPQGAQEVDITIYPDSPRYYERPWKIQGNNDSATSRSFIFNNDGETVILPVIEVLRSILAPNGFLLYRLFESNSFPQFFTETYAPNKIHLSFSSLYELKYTKRAFLYQLIWLLTNRDLRQVYESLAFSWLQEKTLRFEWNFTQPITITARVKENNNTWTVLQIVNVKNKHIPYENISISHPEIQDKENSKEAKKYTYRSINKNKDEEGFTLDEQVDGSTEDFDFVHMNQLSHEYTSFPRVERIKRGTFKQRLEEDENTKRYYGDNDSIRSTADSGGQELARGLEHQMLHEIKAQGELQDFINVLKVLEQYPEVKVIRAFTDVLPEGLGERKFTKLSDGVTKRRYVIAEVYMTRGGRFNVIEVERENRSLSTLILSFPSKQDWNTIYHNLLINLVNASGTWTSKSLAYLESQGIKIIKAKHSSKGIQHRAAILLSKFS
ncbi:Tn7-like element transposition protein TnsE [Lentibacillus sp. Marseille-P4043]|uniref:Tn7-like element transposition protein TnsE n=1 Tax=Lentibacillus sp. Marseille-P4043 TaxID=2040293 RepID=UPI000D0B7CBE|nr:Tn7-like element transposition protein TnsE [Lentibacillus sp. Marseille-P4043]